MSLSAAQENIDLYKGRTIIWGGIILETANRENETVLTIMQTALDSQKRPTNPDKSTGRFMVLRKGFLDPFIYSKGREITVAGVITGKEEQAIGENTYLYPIVVSRHIHLWEKRQEMIYYDPWFHGPPWWYGYPDPWWPRHRYLR